MIDALDIHVKGTVQGVGFRPFVYRLAKKYLISGWVRNDVDGVHIRAEGESDLVDQFVMEISNNAPAAAKVTEIEMHEVPIEPFDTFQIIASDEAQTEEGPTTHISPDLAICADCMAELFDPNDRRYRYPFINCTNCGPRFTVIEKLPYDRKHTSMKDFKMCDSCQAEYDNPEDRRFHAQPDACFDCGPRIWLQEADRIVEGSDETLARAVDMLMEGKILAVKGIGGFHLVCDANNEGALAALRQRKHREGKPFAVMMGSIEDARTLCSVSADEAKVLEGSIRPIVLVQKLADARFAKGLADKLPEIGVMLPYTPLQALLMSDFSDRYLKEVVGSSQAEGAQAKQAEGARKFSSEEVPMLVMTSGNLHDEPIAISNEEALQRLAGIADAFILNDRDITTRFDDSVVRLVNLGDISTDQRLYAIQMIRRARGYAPSAMLTKFPMPQGQDAKGDQDGEPTASGQDQSLNHAPTTKTVFATGPEQKSTFAFARLAKDGEKDGAKDAPKQETYVSQHIGDMERAETFDAWLEARSRFMDLFGLNADVIACDLHPEYLTSKWAHEQAQIAHPPKELIEVQHHFAHVASVIAENSIEGAVCGIAFDGTGYGVDGCIWGGEVLVANTSDFERLANFSYVPMPGGQAAIKEPLRMAYGALWAFDLLDHPAAQKVIKRLGEQQAQTCNTMIEQGINTPVTSSVGRLFDAASAILGVCEHPTYEGEAANLLEAELWRGLREGMDLPDEPAYSIEVVKNTATPESTAQDTSVLLFDAGSAFASMLDDIQAEVPTEIIAMRFHNAFVQAMIQVAQFADALYGIKTVALTGGVFMNRYLIESAIRELKEAGFTVAINRELPPNDGCVSFGQSVVALAKID